MTAPTYPPTVTLYELAAALGVHYQPNFTARFYLDHISHLKADNAWLTFELENLEEHHLVDHHNKQEGQS